MHCQSFGELSKLLRDDDELRGQRVSEIWLKAFLDAGEQAAIARLSVFTGTFNAVGALAFAYGAGVTHARAEVFLLVILYFLTAGLC